MAKDMLAYNNIRSHNLRESTTNMMVVDESHVASLEGMVDIGDPRMLAANLNLDLKTKRIITKSYTSDWRCIMCGPHGSRPAFNMRGAAEGTGGRQAVVLLDQGFPAILPAAGTDKCLVILRIENGSIPDLVDEFLGQFGNRLFPSGSMILIFSAAHLANVGLTAYIQDLLAAESKLQARL
jgi:hypothetical protein